MKTVNMLRAGGDNVPRIKVSVSDVISGKMTLTSAKLLYDSQGKLLCDTLLTSLPGGTIDALLCELLKRKSSLLRIPFVDDCIVTRVPKVRNTTKGLKDHEIQELVSYIRKHVRVYTTAQSLRTCIENATISYLEKNNLRIDTPRGDSC